MKRATLLVWCLAPAWAQSPELTLRGPEPEVVAVGESAQFTLRVEGSAQASLGALAAIEGIAWSAPTQTKSSALAWREGHAATQALLEFVVRAHAQRAGAFELPPFAASLRSDTLTTSPTRLEVLPEIVGREHAFIELRVPSATCFLQERVTVRVRFGFERSFRADNLVPMFMRPLEIAAQGRASWWNSLPGSIVEEADAPNKRASIAWNDAILDAQPLADETRDGHVFAVFELARALLPTHTGELIVPGPALRFAFALRFDDDFVNGRVAAERREGCVRAEPTKLTVLPWPEAGRPAAFTGAVGTFSVQADATPQGVAVGESCKVRVRITGTGNLRQFAAPPIESSDFHVRGTVETASATERVITYDLSPLRADATLPPISLVCFDPTPPGSYRTVRSAAIALVVRGNNATASNATASTPRTPGVDDIFDTVSSGMPRTHAKDPSTIIIACALLAPWLAAALLGMWLRAREAARRDPLGTRARNAAATFRAERAASPEDDISAFVGYLAARLRCQEAAVISPDLASRLVTAGTTQALATRVAHLVEQRAAARYGGSTTKPADADIDAMVAALEDSFRRAEATA